MLAGGRAARPACKRSTAQLWPCPRAPLDPPPAQLNALERRLFFIPSFKIYGSVAVGARAAPGQPGRQKDALMLPPAS